MTDRIKAFWERCCKRVCIDNGITRAELDRGLETGRWHLAISTQFKKANLDDEIAVSLEDGPSPRLQ
jgi:hypothetical protein